MTTRDVNLQPSEQIPAGIAPFEALKTGIFSSWGRGWRQKLSRRHFGAGIEDETSVPVDSPNELTVEGT
ncbi:hypothetical protein L195_g016506 [Trifolium pratense]|uniref:Uncharacterized protein n=1 Tax=Trifolium pratense TaxID=57577 RepID=A0A2K3MRK4_TRIPR|nr:hypothetical protein L195_g016506 [Trifolium pratense]